MKKAFIISSALVLGMSSVALADSSFSFGARGSISVNLPAPKVVVRDHRTPAAPVYVNQSRPTYHPTWQDRTVHPYPTTPAIPANLDCRNWDPAVERGHACEAYSSGYTYAPDTFGSWAYLGTRESAVPDNQFITVGPGKVFSRLKLTAEQGNPQITKVAIRFMDNSVQVINLNTRFRTGSSMKFFLDGGHREINQIVVYTASGSRGTYSITAL
jgi:hypothetical protein